MVTKLKTTYKLKSGFSTTVTNGSRGDHVGTISLDEGVYLKSIKMFRGSGFPFENFATVNWIQFCVDINENCSVIWGGEFGVNEPDPTPNWEIHWENAVIKSLRGHDGDRINRIMAYGERLVDCPTPSPVTPNPTPGPSGPSTPKPSPGASGPSTPKPSPGPPSPRPTPSPMKRPALPPSPRPTKLPTGKRSKAGKVRKSSKGEKLRKRTRQHTSNVTSIISESDQSGV